MVRSFTTVKDLYISREIAPRIAPVLKELSGKRQLKFYLLCGLFLEEPSFLAGTENGTDHWKSGRRKSGKRTMIGHNTALLQVSIPFAFPFTYYPPFFLILFVNPHHDLIHCVIYWRGNIVNQ